MLRMSWILPFYWVSGMMEVVVGYLRGMGYSMMPTIVTLLGFCAFRILWVYTVFAGDRRLETLAYSLPAENTGNL